VVQLKKMLWAKIDTPVIGPLYELLGCQKRVLGKR
jgi:hypothetical protein